MYVVIGAYMNSNSNNNEYDDNLNSIRNRVNKKVEKGLKKVIHMVDLNGDIVRKNLNDVSLREWLDDENHFVSLNRLFTQRAINTYLSWDKAHSNIDYICIRQGWNDT